MPLVRNGRPGLLGAVASTAVVAGTASMTVKAMNRCAERQKGGWQAPAYHVDTGRSPATVAPGTSPGAAGSGLVDQLSRLAELHRAGVLSDAELQTAKTKLLST